jgi:omega-amidase
MQNLKVSTIQSKLEWEQIDLNLSNLESIIEDLPPTDVIILPEMFSTGFTMNAEKLAEEPDGKTTMWIHAMAKKTGALLMGSIICKDANQYYNRLIIANPDGIIDHYDKRHLFRMAKEDETFSFGSDRKIFGWKGWNILPLVCYDLRFPVWSRNKGNKGRLEYDLLIYVANWPAQRISAWDILLKARAIENLSYSIGVNRIGIDGNGIEYNGHTGIYDPKGNPIYFSEKEESITTVISGEELVSYRNKFPANLDSDEFEIK